jgi:hypothetical protein
VIIAVRWNPAPATFEETAKRLAALALGAFAVASGTYLFLELRKRWRGLRPIALIFD